ncbi:MAG: hypothetical protein HRT88_20015 [Lentisphaeraceae bacterium]|nr:hypothetical protein [Lentisphaeraceae bacterium]
MNNEEEYFEYGCDEDDFRDEDLIAICEAYRRKVFIESLIGPVLSTTFHVTLIIILAILIKDNYIEEAAEIEVKMEEIDEVQIEEPPIEEPVPEEIVETTDVTTPVLTTVAIENAESDDAALEDTNDKAPSTDDDSTVEAVSDVTVSPSAFASSSVFGGRSAAGRAGSVAKYGGTKVGQAALLKALMWLAKVQNPDGSWGSKAESRAAITGLALLTYLAHGELPTSKLYGLNVKKAIKWLVNSDTNLRGAHAYPHAIKAYALAEAYAMTGNSSIVPALRQAMTIIVEGQQENGSFDYSYKKGTRLDLSFAGWNYQAMKACYETDIEIPGLENGIRQGIKWLKLSAAQNNSFPYAIDGNKVSGGGKASMRAVGVLSLQIFSEGHTAAIRDELKRISKSDLKEFNWDKAPASSLYSWYYATQAMFQAGKKYWKPWNRVFQKELINNQHKDGYWVYPGNGHESSAGDETSQRIYATSLCSLMLTVYYRYLPSHNVREGFEAKVRKRRKRLAAEVQEDETEIFQFLLD